MITETAENPTNRRQRLYPEAYALLNLLTESWPHVFRHENELPVPLSVGIREEIIRELGGVIEPYVVNIALKIYCAQWSYLHALMAPDAMRICLNGNPIEPVSQEHRLDAEKRLQAAMAKQRSRQIRAQKQDAKAEGVASTKLKPARRSLAKSGGQTKRSR